MSPADPTNFILYVPELRHARFRVTPAGRVVLALELNPVKRLMGWLVRREPVSELELDELCSSAWLSMDGTRSLLEIARLQSASSGDDLDQAVARLVAFTRHLARQGWIRFKDVKQP